MKPAKDVKRQLSPYLKQMCIDYKVGRNVGMSKRKFIKSIDPNGYIDFDGFADYLITKTNKRPQTIRQYLSIIHRWHLNVNENTIHNFEDNADALFDQKEEWLSRTENEDGKTKYTHRAEVKDIDKRRKRFKNSLAIVMKHYLASQKQTALKSYMHSEEFLAIQKNMNPGRRRTPCKEHMSEDVFKSYISRFPVGNKFRTLYLFLFYTGARIGETLQMRKNKNWFDELDKNGNLPHREAMLRISIPAGYAKTDDESATQKLYIAELDVRKEFVDWVNTIMPNHFVFNFLDKGNTQDDKTFLEITDEMLIIRKNMRETMLAANFETKFIDAFTIHSWRVSNIHYTQSITGMTNETQRRARHSSSAMTDYYLQTKEKHFEENLFAATQKKQKLSKNT